MSDEPRRERRILIAEDDPVSRRLLQAFLAKWGYEVVSAVDGAEAASLLEKQDAPALAILDWMMPGVEGPEVCKRLRMHTDRPYTYVLLLTARSQKEDLLRGLESGADDYLTKPFDAQELRARLHVGQRILALESNLIEAREKLRFQATHDPLTNIWNHAVVLDAIRRECARQKREGGTFGVILLDLDYFKRVNDTYGHLVGDAVLTETARRITSSVRPYDTVGRYGGEEFLVLVPSSDGKIVLGLAERIRQAIGSIPFTAAARAVHVTASCGVSVSMLGMALDSEDLVQMADSALYRAKKNGRNRCELATIPDLPDSSSPTALSAEIKPTSR